MSVFDEVYNHSSTDFSKKTKKAKNKSKKNHNKKRTQNHKVNKRREKRSEFIEYEAE